MIHFVFANCFVSWSLYQIKSEFSVRCLPEEWSMNLLRDNDSFIQIQGINYIPVHIKRPSPRHWRHFVVISLFLLLSTPSLATSLDGSSHRFSPRRKTPRWETSVSLSFFTSFCWTSEFSATEATAAPFSTSYNSQNDEHTNSSILQFEYFASLLN